MAAPTVLTPAQELIVLLNKWKRAKDAPTSRAVTLKGRRWTVSFKLVAPASVFAQIRRLRRRVRDEDAIALMQLDD